MINDLNGTPEEGYAILPQYCKKLREINPDNFLIFEITSYYSGSTVILEIISSDGPDGNGIKFKRLFISYKAMINGFVHYRSLLGLDGTHLTSKYGDILLAATAPDA